MLTYLKKHTHVCGNERRKLRCRMSSILNLGIYIRLVLSKRARVLEGPRERCLNLVLRGHGQARVLEEVVRAGPS